MTKEKFAAYRSVQDSGVTNMFAVDDVIQYAKSFANVKLTKEDCLDIMKNYSAYKEQYESAT